MHSEDLKLYIQNLLPEINWEEGSEILSGDVAPEALHALAVELKSNADLAFDYLYCLTCIDWKTHLTMVYFFDSTKYRHNLKLKVKLNRDKPEVNTLSDIWATAEFHEREVYELFGVNFLNHPDLRLLILPDGWEGKNPLRKDFEDPINMVKL